MIFYNKRDINGICFSWKYLVDKRPLLPDFNQSKFSYCFPERGSYLQALVRLGLFFNSRRINIESSQIYIIMTKQITTGLVLMLSIFASSQVGINAENPQATLDVVGKPSDPTSLDGIIVPRMTGDELRAKTYTMSQKGAIIYATSESGILDGQVVNITKEGLYFFDGNVWVAGYASSAGGVEEEVDGIIGNEVLNATANGGLVRSGTGIDSNPYTLGLIDGSTSGQLMTWNGAAWNPASPVNIYNESGTLTNGRTVTLNGNSLTFLSGQSTILSAGSAGFRQDSGSGSRASISLSNGGSTQLWLYTDTNSISQFVSTGNATGLLIGTSHTVGPTPLNFVTSSGSGGVHRAQISGDGRFNIHNTLSVGYSMQQTFSGSERLKVNGSIVTIGATYPDYVFETYYQENSIIKPEYKFSSLYDVENFIKENHHLPGVTSINELEKTEKGYALNLTELSTQTLEKVEELYLYVIEQQKQIDAQKKQIDNLTELVYK